MLLKPLKVRLKNVRFCKGMFGPMQRDKDGIKSGPSEVFAAFAVRGRREMELAAHSKGSL
jgi:hypothetical protein